MSKGLAAAIVAAVLSSGAANAADHALFAFTSAPSIPNTVILTFDGVTPFFAEDTGWLTDRGSHGRSNENYSTGFIASGEGGEFRSFFNFIIGAAAPISPYTSATITFDSGFSIGAGPFDLSLYDVQASIADLDRTRPVDDPVGESIFDDLGSGARYGFSSLPGLYVPGDTITLTLNQTFLDQVNAGLLTTFSIGGSLGEAAVPEPSSWVMTIVGFGAAGWAMRRRRVIAHFVQG